MATIKESYHGKIIETIISVNDNPTIQISISTMKRHNGYISTIAKLERIEGNFITHSMNDPSKILASEKKRATLKALMDQHKNCVMDFKGL